MQPGFRPKCSRAERQPWTIDVSMSSAAFTSYGKCEQWRGRRERWLSFPVVRVFLEHTLLASLSAQHWGWKWKDGHCPWRPHGGGKKPGIWIFCLFVLLKDNCFTEFVFCQTSAWISHKYTYIPSLLKPPPIALPIPPLSVDTEPLFEFPEPYSKFPLAIYFTYGNISFHVTLSMHLILSPTLPTSISLYVYP